MKTDSVRFCPNCGSTWVEPDTSNRAEVFFSGGNPNKWMCRECGYKGLMPEGDPDEDFDEEFSEETDFRPEKVEQVDTDFGIAYMKYVTYILIPLLALYAITLL